MAASGLSLPELALEQQEARSLAEAAASVAAYYPMSFDPKMLAWANLFLVAGTLYGTRAIAVYVRKQKERSPQTIIPSAVVYPPQFDPNKVKLPPL